MEVFSIQAGKPIRKRLLGQPRHTWKDNITHRIGLQFFPFHVVLKK